MIKIFFILTFLLIAGGCSSVPRCSDIQTESEKERCTEENRRWHNENGWRYDRGIRGIDR